MLYNLDNLCYATLHFCHRNKFHPKLVQSRRSPRFQYFYSEDLRRAPMKASICAPSGSESWRCALTLSFCLGSRTKRRSFVCIPHWALDVNICPGSSFCSRKSKLAITGKSELSYRHPRWLEYMKAIRCCFIFASPFLRKLFLDRGLAASGPSSLARPSTDCWHYIFTRNTIVGVTVVEQTHTTINTRWWRYTQASVCLTMYHKFTILDSRAVGFSNRTKRGLSVTSKLTLSTTLLSRRTAP